MPHQAHQATTKQEEIPAEVLATILQHVDQRSRLCSCALVSSVWAKAAQQATRHAICSLKASAQASFRKFSRHGTVQSLELSSEYAGQQIPVIVPLTGLTNLVVQDGIFPSAAWGAAVSSLTQLCQLHLERCKTGTSKPAHDVSAVLEQLPGLLELVLTDCRVKRMPCLLGLTQLHLSCTSCAKPVDAGPLLQQLPSLKVLQLSAASVQQVVQPSLTALQAAQLAHGSVELAVFSSACALTRLELRSCSPALQFSALHGLSELRQLRVAGEAECGEDVLQLCGLRCVSGLTSLQLNCPLSRDQVTGLLQQVVSRANGLQELLLGNMFSSPQGAISIDLLQPLASCCPQLRSLSLSAPVASAHAAPLLLPATCESLTISGTGWPVGCLAQLTRLSELCWHGASLDDGHLRQLTQLASLHKLGLVNVSGLTYNLARAVVTLGPWSGCDFLGPVPDSEEDEEDEGGSSGQGRGGQCFRGPYDIFFKDSPKGTVQQQLQAVCGCTTPASPGDAASAPGDTAAAVQGDTAADAPARRTRYNIRRSACSSTELKTRSSTAQDTGGSTRRTTRSSARV